MKNTCQEKITNSPALRPSHNRRFLLLIFLDEEDHKLLVGLPENDFAGVIEELFGEAARHER